jgi:acetyl-CoA carboxylase biotin carboxylase subunit
VEFLVDAKGNFYFLEMNTRIQVEHPVTEMVTGVDLVQEQFRIAAGQPLPGTLDAGQMRGWALECRIYAENPFNNFAPSPGTIRDLRIPHGPGIRADMGVMAGSRVPAEYDPMIGKITAWAPSREAVIARMARALGECRILGIASNLALHKRILENTEFLSGHYDTGLIERHADSLLSYASRHEHEAVAAAAIMKYRQRAKRPVPPSSTSASGMWLSDGRRRALRKV